MTAAIGQEMTMQAAREKCRGYETMIEALRYGAQEADVFIGFFNSKTEVQCRIQAFGTTEALRTTEKTELDERGDESLF